MGPGGFDMQQIFAAAQQALSAQQELANTEVIGTAGGGAVRAVVSGVGQLLDLTIDPSAIDPADPAESASTIADLVLAAVRDAWDAAVDLQQRQLGALGGAPAGFDLSSLGLPSFGGELAYDEDEDEDEDFEDEDDEDDDEDDDLDYEDRPAGAPHDEPRAFPEEHKD
ncbi:MAG TPA: YbaB/EbfC family nucleoid-associated protein [Trebonia sp.]|nr:YbaB/EbfC family nucleoid-associated protein [Trebonia sp.]